MCLTLIPIHHSTIESYPISVFCTLSWFHTLHDCTIRQCIRSTRLHLDRTKITNYTRRTCTIIIANYLCHITCYIQIVERYVFTTVCTTTVTTTNILLATRVVTLPLITITFHVSRFVTIETLYITRTTTTLLLTTTTLHCTHHHGCRTTISTIVVLRYLIKRNTVVITTTLITTTKVTTEIATRTRKVTTRTTRTATTILLHLVQGLINTFSN